MNVIQFPQLPQSSSSATALLERLAEILSEAVNRDGGQLGAEEGMRMARNLAERIHACRVSLGLDPTK